MQRLIILILFILPLYSCNQQKSDKGDTKPYEDSKSGWTTQFPASFTVMTEQEIAKLEGRGETAMEESLGGQLVLTHTNLLWIKKDLFNSFTSNSQPYNVAEDGPYEETEKEVYEALENTYRSQGIKFDVKYGTEKVDGLDFATMEVVIYAPNSEKMLMTQLMYTRLIDGNVTLTLNANYNNDKDKDLLLDIIKASKFSKRD